MVGYPGYSLHFVSLQCVGPLGRAKEEGSILGSFNRGCLHSMRQLRAAGPTHSDPSGKAKFILKEEGADLTSGWSHPPEFPHTALESQTLDSCPFRRDSWILPAQDETRPQTAKILSVSLDS